MSVTFSPETNFGVTTSFLPLTTPGPFDVACSTGIYSQNGGGAFIAFDPFYGREVDTKLTCLPTQVTSWWDGLSPTTTISVSLGPLSACPSGYTSGSQTVQDDQKTLMGCCPSQYDFKSFLDHGSIGQCVSTATFGATVRYYDFSSSTQISTVVGAGVELSIFGVQVNGYIAGATSTTSMTSTASSSSSAAARTSSSSSSFPSATPASTSSESATSAPTASASASPSGLSSGAKAGVGVGVACAVLALLAALLFFMRRYRRARKNPFVGNELSASNYQDGPGQAYKGYTAPGMSSDEVVEMAAPTHLAQLNGSVEAAELEDSGYHGRS